MTIADDELLIENAGYLRKHAHVLMEIPASEQWIGARDAVLCSALVQIAECLERLAQTPEGYRQ